LDKKNILKDLIWPFQQIVVAIPRFLLCPPGTPDVGVADSQYESTFLGSYKTHYTWFIALPES
jgi:hypothetical protein